MSQSAFEYMLSAAVYDPGQLHSLFYFMHSRAIDKSLANETK
jgi:hypothetical protein